MRPIPLSMPFSAEIINAPKFGKVMMSTVELYNGTMDPEEHLGVYNAQMYVQDMDYTAWLLLILPDHLKWGGIILV